MTDLSDESPSSRLNRRSVERLRERFGDAAMPDLPVRAQLNPEDVPADLVELGAATHEGWHLDNCTDPEVDIHWSSHQAWVRATLAVVLPTHREMVLRDATMQEWEGKLGDLAEEAIRANFTAMIEKLADERMAKFADLIRTDEREQVAKGFRRQADRYEEAGKTADTLGKMWSGTGQAMHLRHVADCIEGQTYEQL